MTPPTGSSGLPWRMLTAWGDLRGSYRGLMATAPSEGKLLFIAMASGLVLFLEWTGIARLTGDLATLAPDEMASQVAAQFTAALLFRTLMLYAVAAGLCWVLCRFGGTGGWYATRGAVFWAFLVAAPVTLLCSILGAVIMQRAPGSGGEVIADAGNLVLALVMAACLAEAHGIHSMWRVFLGLIVASVSVIALTLLVWQMS
ncbi:MAG: hypothetical protein AAF501_16000 [Pseudomonadota bacterium]